MLPSVLCVKIFYTRFLLRQTTVYVVYQFTFWTENVFYKRNVIVRFFRKIVWYRGFCECDQGTYKMIHAIWQPHGRRHWSGWFASIVYIQQDNSWTLHQLYDGNKQSGHIKLYFIGFCQRFEYHRTWLHFWALYFMPSHYLSLKPLHCCCKGFLVQKVIEEKRDAQWDITASTTAIIIIVVAVLIIVIPIVIIIIISIVMINIVIITSILLSS